MKILRDRLSEMDSESRALAESLPRTEGKFARLKSALQADRPDPPRRRINGDYRVLNPEGQGVAAPPEAAAAAGEARKAAAALTLRVEAEGEQGETVAVRIIDGLASRGLRASQGGTGTPDLL